MMTLGIGIFLGFNMEWKTIEYDTSRFFSDTKYADYRLYSETGFTKKELEKIASIDGVDAATRYLSVNLDIKGEGKKALSLDVSENFSVSAFVLISGKEYDERIYQQDTAWLRECDLVIAECTRPSLGVGYAFGAFFLDAAVRMRTVPTEYVVPYNYYTYDSSYLNKYPDPNFLTPELEINSRLFDFILTAGWRF